MAGRRAPACAAGRRQPVSTLSRPSNQPSARPSPYQLQARASAPSQRRTQHTAAGGRPPGGAGRLQHTCPGHWPSMTEPIHAASAAGAGSPRPILPRGAARQLAPGATAAHKQRRPARPALLYSTAHHHPPTAATVHAGTRLPTRARPPNKTATSQHPTYQHNSSGLERCGQNPAAPPTPGDRQAAASRRRPRPRPSPGAVRPPPRRCCRRRRPGPERPPALGRCAARRSRRSRAARRWSPAPGSSCPG
jgi:hypothetical protein